ncbi:MAG TPA: response regulator [Microthrixaceae bacterium]|nr:response regulator [Microthrixaceae bacterium]
MTPYATDSIRILLVEDDPGDVLITREALEESKLLHELVVVDDGEAALDLLHRRGDYAEIERPDLILLDLNLPKISGREVLADIKVDEELRHIPVVVLTTSDAQDDVLGSYGLHANAYVCKPVDFAQFHNVIRAIDDFFLTVVRLPDRPSLP